MEELHVHTHKCYQFRVPRNLRIDIKDRLEEYSQSIPQLKRGQQTLGALVAVVRSFHYINISLSPLEI